MILKNTQLMLSQQKGATLIVALIILLVMTLLGMSSMRSTNTQLKMVTYNQNRLQAFKLAESALEWVEDDFGLNGHSINAVQDCTTDSASCFGSTCLGGLCFNGNYLSANATYNEPHECALSTVSPPLQPYWVRSDLSVWQTSSRHKTVNISGYPGFSDPKYIAEFLCYSDLDANSALLCASGSPNNCIALYRFTVLAESRDAKSRVMLQSVARVPAI
ncbi:PilX N-terminal domain-containing pilus assembly protein [Agaribacterium sp. ZY112]|uniref:pilus assembly PilX family protein n=1 Tax=Agaribacterium sp. ZY112 TaxID=3233574 RepID=UPI00352400B9